MITVWVEEETLDDGRAIFTFYAKDQGVGMSEDFIAIMLLICSLSQESKTEQNPGKGRHRTGAAITEAARGQNGWKY